MKKKDDFAIIFSRLQKWLVRDKTILDNEKEMNMEKEEADQKLVLCSRSKGFALAYVFIAVFFFFFFCVQDNSRTVRPIATKFSGVVVIVNGRVG